MERTYYTMKMKWNGINRRNKEKLKKKERKPVNTEIILRFQKGLGQISSYFYTKKR